MTPARQRTAHLGNGLCHIGEYEKGIAECERAIEIAPNLAMAYEHFAFALNVSGRSEEAIPVIEKAFRLTPLNPPYFHYQMCGPRLLSCGKIRGCCQDE